MGLERTPSIGRNLGMACVAKEARVFTHTACGVALTVRAEAPNVDLMAIAAIFQRPLRVPITQQH
jgi:hypothetical protein